MFFYITLFYLQMLWTKELKMNTVHVEDVCRALWYLCNHGKTGEVYHIVDKGDTSKLEIFHNHYFSL